MAYCTIDDVLKLIDTEVVAGMTSETANYDDDLVNQAITDADSEIDSYLQRRYSVPLSEVPPVVLKISVDIAIYNIYSRRKNPPENRIRRYENAISFLKSVSKGEASLGVESLDVGTTVNFGVKTDSTARVFTSTTMNGF